MRMRGGTAAGKRGVLFRGACKVSLKDDSMGICSFFEGGACVRGGVVTSGKRAVVTVKGRTCSVFRGSPASVAIASPVAFNVVTGLRLRRVILCDVVQGVSRVLKFNTAVCFAIPLSVATIRGQTCFRITGNR